MRTRAGHVSTWAWALLVLVAMPLAAAAAEIALKDGTTVTGEIVDRGVRFLKVRVAVPGGEGIEGTVDRPVPWGSIESVDGVPLHQWLGVEEGEYSDESPGGLVPGSPESWTPRALIHRFVTWLDTGEGAGIALRLGAVVLLVIVPALFVRFGAGVMRVPNVDALRVLAATLLAFAAASAAYKVWPGWFRDWPLAVMGTAGLAVVLVLRPSFFRAFALALLQVVGLAIVVAGVALLAGSST